MACCSQSTSTKGSNGICGQSRSQIVIPQNAISNPIVCNLPCVKEFSSSIQRFRNQITRQVLTALSRQCQALTPPTPPPVIPPGTLILLNNTVNLDQSLSATINLTIPATAIESVNTRLQDVRFELVGVSSAVVQVTGLAVITVTYLAIDGTTQTQTATIPFAFTIVIPGDFPPNIIIQGLASIINQLVTVEIDPSLLVIISVTVTIFFAISIQVLLPAP